ncbi:MAG: hypothetical protein P1P78_14880 [Methyloprofundus sp.]|nr:hypothetical protein [Methyloprofundus sp.]
MSLIVLDFTPRAETVSLKMQGTDNRSAILCPSYQDAYQKNTHYPTKTAIDRMNIAP